MDLDRFECLGQSVFSTSLHWESLESQSPKMSHKSQYFSRAWCGWSTPGRGVCPRPSTGPASPGRSSSSPSPLPSSPRYRRNHKYHKIGLNRYPNICVGPKMYGTNNWIYFDSQDLNEKNINWGKATNNKMTNTFGPFHSNIYIFVTKQKTKLHLKKFISSVKRYQRRSKWI